MRYWVALVLVAVGLGGVVFGYPLSPSGDPAVVDARFPGSYAAPGVVTVTTPGPHTVWEAGPARNDGNRCRVTAPDGAGVTVTTARLPVRWETDDSDAVDTWTAMGSFDAPVAGGYRIECAVDPATPGTSFRVTAKPSVALSAVALHGGAVAILAGVVVAVATLLRRRRATAPQNGGSSS